MKKELVIGTARAAPGTRAHGAIPVGTRSGGGAIEIPLIVMNGADDGPLLWIDGAIHGDEHEGPISIFRLMQQVNPKELRGALVGVPVLNVGAWESSQRGNPMDLFTYDLNRIYPGRADGHLTERIAHIHHETMLQFADMEISIHSGGAHSFLAYAQFYTPTDAGTELAKAMGPKWDLLLKSFSDKGSPQAAMKSKGRPAITVELGGTCDLYPERFHATGEHLSGCFLNVLRHYKMVPGQATYAKKWYIGQQKTVVLAPASGFWLPVPTVLRQFIKAGTVMARIHNLYGDVIAEIKAPVDGIPFGMRTNPAVQLGDWCVFYGVIDEEITA